MQFGTTNGKNQFSIAALHSVVLPVKLMCLTTTLTRLHDFPLFFFPSRCRAARLLVERSKRPQTGVVPQDVALYIALDSIKSAAFPCQVLFAVSPSLFLFFFVPTPFTPTFYFSQHHSSTPQRTFTTPAANTVLYVFSLSLIKKKSNTVFLFIFKKRT